MNIKGGLENWRLAFGFEDDSGVYVTPQTALNLSAWWSTVRLISETIATLPIGVFRKVGDEREAVQGYFLYELLHDRPNEDQTPVEWWEGRVAPLCTHGNSYSEKKFLGDRIVALHPLNTEYCMPVRLESGRLVYRVTDRGKTTDMPPEKIFHVRGFAPNDELEGLSPVAYAARSLGGAISAERAAARVYSSGLRTPGFWVPPVDMNQKQRDDFIKNYVKPIEGAKGEGSGRFVVPPGFDWKNMSISPKDAEMLMTRRFNVEDVCRWMGVPPILIGHSSEGQTMWGSGVEQIILGWLVLGLRAYLKRIESAVNTRLIPLTDRRNGVFFEFNFEGLLRADSAGRAQLMSTLAQNGLRTRNELRKLDNMPAMAGGDELTVQSALVPLDQIGQKQQQSAEVVRNAMRNWLLEERKEAA
jgi:HK97 family phage portal protein